MTPTPYFVPPLAQRYGPPEPAPAPEPPPPATPAWAKLLGVVFATAVSLPAAVVTAWIAAIEYTGCFLGCRPENVDVVSGLALAALAALLCAAGPLVGARLYRSRTWLLASIWVAGGAAVLMLAYLADG